jgi:hypothetical protein
MWTKKSGRSNNCSWTDDLQDNAFVTDGAVLYAGIMKNVTVERIFHDGMNRVVLRFPYDNNLIAATKELTDARWSSRLKCWHVADCSDIIALLLKVFHGKAYVDYTALKPTMAEKIKAKRETGHKTPLGMRAGFGEASFFS